MRASAAGNFARRDGRAMPQALTPDLCVIGAGPGGLAAAMKAASHGVRVALIERARMGGQAWYTGSLASKSLIASAKRVHDIRNAWMLGVKADGAGVKAGQHGNVLGRELLVEPEAEDNDRDQQDRASRPCRRAEAQHDGRQC